MRAFVVALSLVTPLLSAPSMAAEPVSTPKSFVERGLAAYATQGATAAINTWIKGSALEGNTLATTQANSLRQIEDFYGKPQGGEVLKEVPLSERVRVLYFTVTYEKGVAFGKFQAYRQGDGTWIATSFFFHTEAAQIWPASLLESGR